MTATIASRRAIPAPIMLRLMLMAFIEGVVLGQLIDFAYPISDALHYEQYFWKVGNLEFCWVIDILYGVAGVILWSGTVILDRKFGDIPRGGWNPSWKFMLSGCAFFIVQFYIGPYMCGVMMLPNFVTFIFTISTGILCWWIYDRTRTGICMMITAAILGPLAELFMINFIGFYHYTRPDIWGIPLWFIGAYICGVAPSGNLARKFLTYLESKQDSATLVGKPAY